MEACRSVGLALCERTQDTLFKSGQTGKPPRVLLLTNTMMINSFKFFKVCNLFLLLNLLLTQVRKHASSHYWLFWMLPLYISCTYVSKTRSSWQVTSKKWQPNGIMEVNYFRRYPKTSWLFREVIFKSKTLSHAEHEILLIFVWFQCFFFIFNDKFINIYV